MMSIPLRSLWALTSNEGMDITQIGRPALVKSMQDREITLKSPAYENSTVFYPPLNMSKRVLNGLPEKVPMDKGVRK